MSQCKYPHYEFSTLLVLHDPTMLDLHAPTGSHNYVVPFDLDLHVVCQDRLGMENGDIPDSNIQASHENKDVTDRNAEHGRLNGSSLWAAFSQDDALQPWIQADIGIT